MLSLGASETADIGQASLPMVTVIVLGVPPRVIVIATWSPGLSCVTRAITAAGEDHVVAVDRGDHVAHLEPGLWRRVSRRPPWR